MSVLIKGMKLPKRAAVDGEKDTVYRCAILAHPDNSVDLIIDTKFASAYDNGHNIQRYPITEIPTPHGRLIDADELIGYLNEWLSDSVALFGFTRIINHQPTIIEAEVSE